MKTGIVFKIKGNKAIVLKTDGTFAFVRAGHGWKVGETVSVSAELRGRLTFFLVTAACLAVAFLGTLGWNQLYRSPTAIISIDVNPSIELNVNYFNRIVSATGLNDEGMQILKEANIKNIEYQDAIVKILNTEGIDGYLINEANVVLTVFSSNSTVQSSLLAELQGVVDSTISFYSDHIETEYHAVDERSVNGAHGQGITAGKYMYLQKLQELEPELEMSQLTHHSIDQIKEEIEACQQEHGAGGGDATHGKDHTDKKGCK